MSLFLCLRFRPLGGISWVALSKVKLESRLALNGRFGQFYLDFDCRTFQTVDAICPPAPNAC